MPLRNAYFGNAPLARYSMGHLIQWGSELSVDDPHIDAQHQAIFALAMEVHDHWRRNAGLAELRTLVDKLFNVLQSHFSYEERLLKEMGYPQLEKHAAEHRGMLDELARIRQHLTNSRSRTPLPPGFALFNFVLGLTVGHICNSDLDYCQYAAKLESRADAGPGPASA